MSGGAGDQIGGVSLGFFRRDAGELMASHGEELLQLGRGRRGFVDLTGDGGAGDAHLAAQPRDATAALPCKLLASRRPSPVRTRSACCMRARVDRVGDDVEAGL